jgi:hypothetical protein
VRHANQNQKITNASPGRCRSPSSEHSSPHYSEVYGSEPECPMQPKHVQQRGHH